LVFELTVPGAKRGYVLVAFLNSDEVFGIPKVKFREDPSPAQPVKHL
jgi:hypothetical protein